VHCRGNDLADRWQMVGDRLVSAPFKKERNDAG
jgi:hypothetical protein